MVNFIIAYISFAVGAILQAVFMVYSKFKIKKEWPRLVALIVVMAFIFSMAFLDNVSNRSLESILFISLMGSLFMFSLTFADLLLERIDKSAIIIFSTIAFYIFVTKVVTILPNYSPILITLYLLGFGLTIAIIFMNNLSKTVKVLAYAWYLIATMLIFLQIFAWYDLVAFFNSGLFVGAPLTYLDLFFAGLITCFLLSRYVMILRFIVSNRRKPLFRIFKKQNEAYSWKKYINEVYNSFTNSSLKPLHSLLVIVLLSGVLFGNHHLSILPESILISVLMVASFVLVKHLSKNNLTEEEIIINARSSE